MPWSPFRIMPPDYVEALREVPNVRDNPFFWRDKRRAERVGEPFRTLFSAALWLGAALLGAQALVWLASMTAMSVRWSVMIGALPFSVVSAVHFYLVVSVAQKAVRDLMASEVRQGTLLQLLATPRDPFEIIALLVAFPAQKAGLAALAGLPIHLYLCARGYVSPVEILVLYILFAAVALYAPRWKMPALVESTPEEMSAELHRSEQNAGCANFVLLLFIFLPGSAAIGGIVYGLHLAFPTTFQQLPTEIWTMSGALPLTHIAILVKVLSAPLSWFGVPLPLCVWSVPFILVRRVTTMWDSSLYLRVSHTSHVRWLRDYPLLSRWGKAWTWFWSAVLAGYAWDPLLLSGALGWLVAPPGSIRWAETFTGWILTVGIVCSLMVLIRLRRHARAKTEADAERQRVLEPLIPLGVMFAIGLVGHPAAVFALVTLTTAAKLAATVAAALALAWACRRLSDTAWWTLALSTSLLPFAPWPLLRLLGAVSPLVALPSAVPRLNDLLNALVQTVGQVGGFRGASNWTSPFVYPPWWASVLVQLVAALVLPLLMKRLPGRQPAADAARPAAPVPEAPVAGPPGPLPAPVPAAAWTNGNGAPVPPAAPAAAQQPPMPGEAGHAVADGARAYAYRGAPRNPAPFVWVYATNQEPAWRVRRISAIAGWVLRKLLARTDNPLVVDGARRWLPGSMGVDNLIVGAILLGMGVLGAVWAPSVILYVPFPFAQTYADFLYGGVAQGRGLGGCALAVQLGLVMLLAPSALGRRISAGYLKERDRASLPFLLVTPLPDRALLYGFAIGPVLPVAAFMGECVAAQGFPALILCAMGTPFAGLWGWFANTALALTVFLGAIVSGTWVGITRANTKSSPAALLFMPLLCLLPGIIVAGAVSALFPTPPWVHLSLGIVLNGVVLAAWWRACVERLGKLRRGDLVLGGRGAVAKAY